MINEFTLGKTQHRGVRAEELLGDGSIFSEACNELEKICLNQWRETKAFETAERENVWRTLKAVDAVRHTLKQYIINGRIAAEDLRRFSEELEKQNVRRRKSGTH